MLNDFKNITSHPSLDILLKTPKLTYTEMEPPPLYKGTLQPHQKKALGFAVSRARTMLALDCGLGKTHIGMAYMLLHLPALVVCPASLRSSWIEHIEMFAPGASDRIEVISYSSLRKVKNKNINSVVADEAHYLKHESSQRSKQFCLIQKQCKRTLLLTGTPAQRNMDIFHLLKILDGKQFPHFYHYKHKKKPGAFYFADRYCIPEAVWIGGTQHGFKFTKNNHTSELALICEHYILRMKKDDVLDLPTLTLSSVIVGKTASPAYYKTKWTEIEDIREKRGNRIADCELLALCRESTFQKLPFVYKPVDEWSVSNPGKKCILFYHHKDIGDKLAEMVEGLGISYIRIDGKTTMKKRCTLLDVFKNNSECRIGILSLCATSTGLNLQFCTKIFFVEMTFLSVHHTQAESRIHRIGQTQDVSVTYLLLDGTTDMMLWNSLKAKRRTEAMLFDLKSDSDSDSDPGTDLLLKDEEMVIPL
jgi:SWI/SNF-related matrix-associated actin-dependent regulator 1 of chromatin subfamily A